MHALKIPFTGLIVGGISVVIVSLICFLSSNSRQVILKSLIIVLSIKLAISPHSSFTAYFAVSFQALAAWFFFRYIPSFSLASYITAIVCMLESAMQKIIILTIFYGNTLWEAINAFGKWAVGQAGVILPFSSSEILISSYILIYFINGILVGYFTFGILKDYHNMKEQPEFKIKISASQNAKENQSGLKNNVWWNFVRKGTIWIIVFVCLVLLLIQKDHGGLIFYFIIRVLLIFSLWYGIIGPFIKSRIQHYVQSGDKKVIRESEQVVLLFPYLKQILVRSWQSAEGNWLIKIPVFLRKLIFFVICFEIHEEENISA